MLWYLMRAFGLVSLIALTASTALGALATVGGTDPVALDRRLLRQLVHRSCAVIGLVALVLHIVCAVVDSYVDVSVSAAILPFGSGFRPVATAVGVLGVYAVVAAALSGALRGRLAASARAARCWRAVHTAAYAGWLLSMAHGLFSGTDTHAWWGAAVYAASGLAVFAAFLTRIFGERLRRDRDPRGHLRLTGAHR
ncbi:ferric reductase [Nocardioides sp. DS6]|uniref:Ferric reductase n=1 Tax=Nocardioides eburneus TaxID=3231482 RepID=A0ABV3T659_9ACTN